MEDENHDELVELYVLKRLEGDSLRAFEQKLRLDEQLRKQVEAEATISRHLKREGRQHYKLRLKELHQRMDPAAAIPEPILVTLPKEESFTASRWRWMVAAGVTLLLVGTLATAAYFTRSATPDALFAAYFHPHPATQIVRGTPAEDRPETAGLVAYSQGNYSESIRLFRQALGNERNEMALFYLGNAYLSAGQPAAAIQIFSQYLRDYQEYEVEANWYLGLSYLKTGNPTAAKKILAGLATRENRYQNDAARLLDELE